MDIITTKSPAGNYTDYKIQVGDNTYEISVPNNADDKFILEMDTPAGNCCVWSNPDQLDELATLIKYVLEQITDSEELKRLKQLKLSYGRHMPHHEAEKLRRLLAKESEIE